MNCDRVQRMLDALVDGELPCFTAWWMNHHLARCSACAAAAEETRTVGEQARIWRNVTAPPALRERVAVTLATASPEPEETPEAARSLLVSRKERIWMHTKRWGWIATMAAVLLALWVGSQRGGDALAAAIRATDAAPAIHIVGRGTQGTEIEAWLVADSGYYVHLKEQGSERILVDDRQRHFEYDTQRRYVEIQPSGLGDPQTAARILGFYTGTSLLKELQRGHIGREVRVGTAVWAGRRLRQLTAPGERQTIYVDPKTDLVVLIEERGSHAHPATELLRYELDYPDPSTVDRGRFRFDIPPGASVKDRTEEMAGLRATPEQQMSRAREEEERARKEFARLHSKLQRR